MSNDNVFMCPQCNTPIANIFESLCYYEHGHYSNIKLLEDVFIFFKDSINDENENGETPLRYIVELYKALYIEDSKKLIKNVIRKLLDCGADPHFIEKDGKSVYDYASQKKLDRLVKVFDEYFMIKEPYTLEN